MKKGAEASSGWRKGRNKQCAFSNGGLQVSFNTARPDFTSRPASEAPSDASLLRCPNAVHGSSIVWRHISGEISFLRCWVFFPPNDLLYVGGECVQ